MEIFQASAIPLFALSIPYVIWLDRRLIEPRDGAWHLGTWMIGQPGWEREAIHHHFRIWAVKGFFIAFMFSIVPGGFGNMIRTPFADMIASPVAMAQVLIGAMFVIDVAFATVGYVLTLKPLDAHIRSANPLMAGWVAALICYPPFILMGSGGPLDYQHDENAWVLWLQGKPVLLALVGALLVLLTAIYAWATVAFGLRFSNLTNRGVLTHGPYAWTKHPAYLSKNAFWWISALTFLPLSGSMVDAVRNTAILAAVSAVYFWRAKTEERHIGLEDPAYGVYAAWMAEHGPITSRINRLLGKSNARMAKNPAE
jgi:protein-S-isoprenylcysteine O-methyltransferase Ste14